VGWLAASDPESRDLPRVVLIKFDRIKGELVGQETRQACKYSRELLLQKLDEDVIPVEPITAQFVGTNWRTEIKRTQYALILADAITIHKCQGGTLEKMVLSLTSKSRKAGLAYVALSQVTSIDGLYLVEFDPASIMVDRHVIYEMNRLRKVSSVEPSLELKHLCEWYWLADQGKLNLGSDRG
ncbi:MAG: hypothetical protein GY696_39590, partial [Gammaproteobacteria bacterium]|nr:hypothetical protein [Gammaproteobacteria bacterium]